MPEHVALCGGGGGVLCQRVNVGADGRRHEHGAAAATAIPAPTGTTASTTTAASGCSGAVALLQRKPRVRHHLAGRAAAGGIYLDARQVRRASSAPTRTNPRRHPAATIPPILPTTTAVPAAAAATTARRRRRRRLCQRRRLLARLGRHRRPAHAAHLPQLPPRVRRLDLDHHGRVLGHHGVRRQRRAVVPQHQQRHAVRRQAAG